MSRLLAVVALLLAALGPAAARPASDAEIAALEQRIDSFDTAMRNGDFGAIITVIPPPMIQHIADGANVSVDALRAVMAEEMAKVLDTVELVSFGMDLDSADHHELADGTPYLLIPTETVLKADALGTMKISSHTLAMLDAGDWYLVRTSDVAMVGILRQVYPQFTGVAFPADTTTPLGE